MCGRVRRDYAETGKPRFYCIDSDKIVFLSLQLDMEMEAHNLSKFSMLMKGYDTVKFPTPLYPFVTKSVLVESYEVI